MPGSLLNLNLNSVAVLAALAPIVGQGVVVSGFASAGDGGGGTYRFHSEMLKTSANGGSIIASTFNTLSTGCWVLDQTGFLSVKQFGARGDFTLTNGSTSDDTAAFQTCANACLAAGVTLRIPASSGFYRITNTVNLRNITIDARDATTYVDTTAIGVILGGTSTNASNPEQNIGTVYRNTGLSGANASIRVVGAKGSRTWVHYTDFLELWADMTNVVDGSLAYSTFYINYAKRLNLTAGPNPGWINENDFYLNRCLDFSAIGSTMYRFNHNRIHGGCFEGTASIYMAHAFDNKFYNMRFELGPTTITFDTDTDRNIIINTWSSSPVNGWPNQPLIAGTITNNSGPGNLVLDEGSLLNNAVMVAEADMQDVVLNTADASSPTYQRSPSLTYVTGLANRDLMMSDFLSLNANDNFFFAWDQAEAGTLYRPTMYFYDKNFQPLNVDATWYSSAWLTAISGNRVSSTNGLPTGGYATILPAAINAGAAYLRLGAWASSGQTGNATARKLYAILLTPQSTSKRSDAVANKRTHSRPYVVTAIPTAGYAPLGFYAVKNDGTARYWCVGSGDTSVTAAAGAGSATITVANAAGFTAGAVVGVAQTDGSTFWTTVSSVSGTNVTLAAALPVGCAAGVRATANTWKTETVTIA
jgi:hypothetical protein